MPNRFIKESICTSDKINSLNWFEEVLFYRLIVSCDDYGRYDGRSAIIKNKLFPLKDSLTVRNVEVAVNKLVSAGLVALYEYEGKPFLYLPTWNDHQSTRAAKSKYPDPEKADKTVQPSELVKASENICNQVQADVPVFDIRIRNSYSNSGERKRFAPPSLAEVQEYCRERKNTVSPERFIDYYTANGWKVGKNSMKDWKAAVRSWERNGYDHKLADTGLLKGDSIYDDVYK